MIKIDSYGVWEQILPNKIDRKLKQKWKMRLVFNRNVTYIRSKISLISVIRVYKNQSQHLIICTSEL